MKYNETYQKHQNVWGKEPSELVKIIFGKANLDLAGKYFLDLGCGQGRDSFFAAQKGMQVVAVDSSKTAIDQINGKNIKNIQGVFQLVENFEIEKGKYFIVSAHNVFQFIPKEKGLKTIEKIKNNILPGGFVTITAFVNLDQGKYQPNYFEGGELKELFSDFEAIHYFEGKIDDTGHSDAPEPHQHSVVGIVVKRNK